MDTVIGTERPGWAGFLPGVSWASVLAGAFVSAAVSLPLIALGAGLGLATVSPWSGSAVSGSTFTNITGAYLVVIAVMSSAIGGYLSARLRTKWADLHTNEIFFRDSAHGFVAWAFATVLSAAVLGSAGSYLVGAAASGAASAAQNANAVFVDKLFRPNDAAPPTGATTDAAPAGTSTPANGNRTGRGQVERLWTASFANGVGLQADDKAYVARVVAQQTGLSEADAQKRVDDVVNQTKAYLDQARHGAMKLAFWMAVALIFGAFAASLAAVEGGQHRDGTWSDRKLVPRAW